MDKTHKSQLPYVLITPARNEERHIGKIIQSMIAQTVLPLKWVIVNDGSTDATASIVEPYARETRLDRTGKPSGASRPNFRRQSLCVQRRLREGEKS